MSYKFNGTPGEWKIRVMSDGYPFIWAPRVKETAGYDIEVFGDRDGNNYPDEMMKADFMLGAASKELLFAAIDFLEKVESGKSKSTDSYNKFKNAVGKALTVCPEYVGQKSLIDSLKESLNL